jgi:hypothetical protein
VSLRTRATSLAWLALALVSCVPLFVVKHPPLQDLPIHLAAIRVIHSHGDPAYGLQDDFVLTLGRTQYVLYYLLASACAYVVGVVRANLLLVCVYLGGTTLAMRDLARSLRRDERVALFVPPVLVNVMFLLGLFPFLFAIPVMLWGIATAIRYFERPSPARGVVLAAIGACLFVLHVFPFALFALAYAAAFPWSRPGRWVGAALPAVPSVALVFGWTFFTPEGHLARGALLHPERPSPLSPIGKLKDAYNWLGDVFRDLSDEVLYGATVALAIAAIVLAIAARARGTRVRWSAPLRAYTCVPIACLVMLLAGGDQHGHIWLIWQRFPLLLAVTAIPLLPFPRKTPGRVLTGALAGVALATALNAAVHFVRFDRGDAAGFDAALASMKPRKHVAGLVFDPETSVTWRHPLVHFASYYQVASGGVVEFTFACYPHWPYRFREGHEPPSGCPARLNWEWNPDKVRLDELYPYYDYVITRGKGFDPPQDRYRVAWEENRWRVFEKVTGP